MPSSEQPDLLRDCLYALEAAANVVTDKTNADKQKYWLHWEQYASTAQINPFLDPSVPTLERNIVAGAFGARVRTGKYRRWNQIKVSGVSDALAAIYKTIELDGKPSQLYRAENKYQLHLERLVESFQRVDPPTILQLAVTVSVPRNASTRIKRSNDPLIQRIICLVLVAFLFFALGWRIHETKVCD